jgi:hypothetical protein
MRTKNVPFLVIIAIYSAISFISLFDQPADKWIYNPAHWFPFLFNDVKNQLYHSETMK